MKKIYICMILVLIIVTFTACNRYSDMVKDVVNAGSEKVYILKENRGHEQVTENKTLELSHLKKITEADYGFYLKNDDILIGRKKGDKIDFTVYSKKTEKETFLMDISDGKYYQISPDGRNLLLAKGEYFYVVFIDESLNREKAGVKYKSMIPYLEISRINWMEKENVPLYISLTWLNNDLIAYSDRDGNVYARSLDGDYFKKLILDSNFKLNISKIEDRFVFIKNRGYKNLDLKINEPAYDRFLQKQKNNYLAFADDDTRSQIIIKRKDNLHIKRYKISPDRKKIALYFEDENNNGLLTITDFAFNILYKNLIHVSNDLINDFIWSRDSENLIYSTSGQIPGLFIVNRNGTAGKQLIANKNLSSLNWSQTGNSFLAVARNDDKNYLYEIILND